MPAELLTLLPDMPLMPDVPLKVLQPNINMLEMDFRSPQTAGMTINRLPLTGSYNNYQTPMFGKPNPANLAEVSEKLGDLAEAKKWAERAIELGSKSELCTRITGIEETEQ